MLTLRSPYFVSTTLNPRLGVYLPHFLFSSGFSSCSCAMETLAAAFRSSPGSEGPAAADAGNLALVGEICWAGVAVFAASVVWPGAGGPAAGSAACGD